MFYRVWKPAALILIIVVLWRSDLGGSPLGTQDLVSRLPPSVQNHTLNAVQAGNRLLGQLPGTQDLVSRLPPSIQNQTISAVQAGQRFLDQLPGIKDSTINFVNNIKSFKALQFSLGGAASGNGGADGTKSAAAAAAPAASVPLQPLPLSKANQPATTTASTTTPPVEPAKATSTTRPPAPKDGIKLTARSTSSSQPGPAIPRSIHFINVSPNLKGFSGAGKVDGLSRKQKENVEGWRRLHPAPRWNVTVWDDSKVLSELPGLAPLLKRVPHPAWASNILRYSILERQGGLFLELDMAALRPVDDLVDTLGPFGVCEFGVRNCRGRPQTIEGQIAPGCIHGQANMNVIAATKGWDVVGEAASRSLAASKKILKTGRGEWARETGSGLWSRVLSEKHGRVLCAATFNMCSSKKRLTCSAAKYANLPHAYGVHMWQEE